MDSFLLMRLAAIVRKVLEKERRLRIVILGPDNAGKTSLLRAYMNKEISSISPTYGYQIVTTEHTMDEKVYILEILDIGGQESIRAYWDTYYTGADGVLFVYDTHGNEDYKKIIAKAIGHPTLRNAAFICASNKADQNTKALNGEDVTKFIKIKTYKKENDVPISIENDFDFMKDNNELCKIDKKDISQADTHKKSVETVEETEVEIVYTSAKTGKNVKKIFSKLIENILEKRKKNGILY